jgi:predicted DsbA family dithiol-disulfide isomerase
MHASGHNHSSIGALTVASDCHVRIDVIFDVCCPWCYIGKRHLDQAIAARPFLSCIVNWRPFLLNPDIPPGGTDRLTYLTRKYGSAARVKRMHALLAEYGAGAGIDLDFSRLHFAPNTLDAHQLIAFAAVRGLAGEAVEALFKAYFLDGRDIGNRRVLLDIGFALGLDHNLLGAVLAGRTDIAAVHAESAWAQRLGITGVPAFVFAPGLVICGAQDPLALAKLLDVAQVMLPAGLASAARGTLCSPSR